MMIVDDDDGDIDDDNDVCISCLPLAPEQLQEKVYCPTEKVQGG